MPAQAPSSKLQAPRRTSILVGLFAFCISVVFCHGQQQVESSDTLIAEARAAASHENPQEARRLLAEIAQRHATTAGGIEAEFLLAQIAAKDNRTDEAMRGFQKVLARDPKGERAAASWYQLSLLHATRKNRSGAQAARQKLLDSFPESSHTAEIWLPLAKAALEEGNFQKAHEIFSAVQAPMKPEFRELADLSANLVKTGNSPTELLQAAGKLMDANQIAQATAILEYWKKQFPKSEGTLEAETRLGWCYFLQLKENPTKHLEKAEALWRGVVAKGNPRDPWVRDAHWHLVQLHSGPKNDWRQAVEISKQIAKVAPQGSVHQEQALLAGAWLLFVHKDYHASQQMFEELEKAHPNTASLPPVIKYREQIAQALEGKVR